MCPIETAIAEIGAHSSADAECRIERAITEITHSGEVVEIRRVIARADCNNLPVRLDQNRKGIIFGTEEIGRNRAAVAKGRVQTSIRIVTSQGKIGIRHIARIEIDEIGPGSDDFPVRLQCHCECEATVARENRRYDSTGTERPIERPVRVIADHFKIAACDHDFAVSLYNHC